MVTELYPKIYEKRQKTGIRRNAVIPKQKGISLSKFDTKIAKTVTRFCQNFKVVYFELKEKNHVKKLYGWAGSGWAGPAHYGYRSNGQKVQEFVLYNISEKSMVSEISLCLKVPYECGKKLSCELAPFRSQLL